MKKNKKRKDLLIIFSVLQIASACMGLYLAYTGDAFMSVNPTMYFTIQSNIVITVVMIIYLIRLLLDKKTSRLFNIIQLISTVGIFCTFVVFAIMLTPEFVAAGHTAYLLSLDNLTIHFFSPIFAIITFILTPDMKLKKFDVLYGTVLPIYYLIFSFINKFWIGIIYVNEDGSTSSMPYFFMNYEENGWFTIGNSMFELGFFYWIIILSLGIICLAAILKLLNEKIKY